MVCKSVLLSSSRPNGVRYEFHVLHSEFPVCTAQLPGTRPRVSAEKDQELALRLPAVLPVCRAGTGRRCRRGNPHSAMRNVK
jgi:hypothetical protein